MIELRTINQMVNMKYWQDLQNSISKVTGMAIVIVDYRGIPVTAHSGCCEFCKRIRNDGEFREYCQKCDARGGLESFRNNRPYIYRCHFSIIDIAVPIIANGNYLGAILAGQIRLADEKAGTELEQIYIHGSQKRIDEKKKGLWNYYKQIPVLSGEQCENTIKMLDNFSKHIVAETLQNDSFENDHKKEGSSICAKRIKNVTYNQIIANALEYMESNKGQFISLGDMAQYCHVSSAYFSRLFVKEVGESYSLYVSKLKVTWAKDLLEHTDMTITEISYKLGFSDPGYFIRIYKNSVGVTPAFYRTHFRNRSV